MHHQSIKKERTICQSLLCLDLVSFSVLSRMKLQVGWLCVVVCRCRCRCLCRCVWLWLWLWCVCVCGVVTPCVHPKRPFVYRQHVHTCQHMWVWCRYTRSDLDGHTEGGSHRQFCLPKFAHEGYHVPKRFNKETHGCHQISV